MTSTTKFALAAALALGTSTAAFAQGGTVGGPSAAGAPQPSTSNPDDAVLNNKSQNNNMQKNTKSTKPSMKKKEPGK